MKTICMTLTGVLALGLIPSASAQLPILRVGQDCKTVSAPDMEVTVADPNQLVVIKVYSKCSSSPAAVLGAFRALDTQDNPTGNFYPALKCAYTDDGITTPFGEKVGTIKCTVNFACFGDYEYNVCVAGKWVHDPEIRIKGGTRNAACTMTNVKPPAPAACTKFP